MAFYGFGQAQTAVFKARFKNFQNGEPILYAKVKTSEGSVQLTNVDGDITYPVKPGDKIVVSHLVYDTLFINADDWIGKEGAVLYMMPRTYELREITFSILGKRSLFDNTFVKKDLGKTESEKIREKLNLKDMTSDLRALDQAAQDGAVLGSPISFLYDKYSKAGKERAKYNALVARDREHKMTLKLFDDLTVTTLTNFQEEELAKFKAFCEFHPTYLDAVDALTLYFEILRCREEYIEKGLNLSK